jgi:zinc and cadmium transporter
MYASALIAVTIVSLLSLLGAIFIVTKRTLVTRLMSLLLALSSGVLLGSAFFDLIPESQKRIPDMALPLVVIGIVSFFTIEKLMHWHHHIDGDGDHPGETKPMGYLTLFGDGIHNFIDGVIIGDAFLISVPLGISVTIAVIAHEIPHELSDFAILIHSGFSNKKALLFNFLSATTAILGTILILSAASFSHSFVPFLVPFGAGNFLYIALSDLVPELHKPHPQIISLIQIAAIIAGAMLIYVLPRG